MADNNNASVATMPKTPNPALKKLDRLVGTWKVSGPNIDGEIRFEWMEGSFFLIQHFDFTYSKRKVRGVEYISFDEDTETLRSHMMDTVGSNFTYTWNIEGDTLTIWFGDKDSDNFYRGKFSDDGNVNSGRWQWPEGNGKIGGYEATMTRLK
jgi:hypothetical protein